MTNEQIEKIIQPKVLGNTPVQISFKSRASIKGIFINSNDFEELKAKNLWRIVAEARIDNYNSSKDGNLARIFNGSEFVKLVLS